MTNGYLTLRTTAIVLVLGAMIGTTANRATATIYTWNPTGTGGWGGNAAWTPTGSFPDGAGQVGFFNSTSYTNMPSIGGGTTRTAAVWDVGSGSLNFTGAGTLTLSATTLNGNANTGIELDSGAGSLNISFGTLNVSNAQTWINNSALGVLSISSSVNNKGNLLTITGSGITVLSGTLAGAGGLTMSGTQGLLALAGTDTYSGTTTISGGTILLANSLGMQNSTLDYNGYGGTLSFGTLTAATLGGLSGSQSLDLNNASSAPVSLTVGNNNASTTYGGVLSGGSLTKSGSGTLTLTANETFNGLTVAAGTLLFGPASSFGGGNYAGNIAITASTAVLNYGGTTAMTLSGVLSGSGGLTMSGANANLTLTASDAYGPTNVTAGTLTIGPTATVFDNLSNGGMTVSGSNAVVDIQGNYSKPAAAPLIVSNGGVVNISGGTFSATNATGLRIGASGTGTLNMTSGLMTVNLNATSGNLNVGYGATGIFNLTGGTLSLTNLSNLKIGNNASGSAGTLNIGGSGVLIMNSSGVLQMGNGAGMSGVINLNSGGLLQTNQAISIGGGTGTLNFNGGTLAATAGTSSFIAVTTANVQNGGAIIDDGGNIITVGQSLLQGPGGSTGGLYKTGSGSLILTNSSTYIGATTLNSGTLQLGSGASGQDGSLTSNTIVNNAAVAYNLFGNQVYSGAIGGSGSVTKLGGGMLTLSGSNSFNGPTTVAAGVLSLPGTLAHSAVTVLSGGTLASLNNSAGVIGGSLNVNGSGALAMGDSTSSLAVGGGVTLGTDGPAYGAGNYATLNYTLGNNGLGAVSLGLSGSPTGTLSIGSGGAYISLNNSFAHSNGTLTLFSFASQTGAGQFSLSATAAGVTSLVAGRDNYTLLDNAQSLQLIVAATPNPAVAYFNGAVSSAWNDASNPTLVNWSSNLAGTTDAGNIPGDRTDVILTATNGTLSGGAVATTLGGNLVINSLNVNSAAASNTINADGSTLTILAKSDSNTDTGGGYTGNPAGNGIAVAAGAGPVTVNVPVVLGSSQTWTNGSANLLQLTGNVSGSASSSTQTLTLANTGAGGMTLSGAIGDGATGGSLAVVVNNSGSGITLFNGPNTYSGGTTISSGTLQAVSFNALGAASGALTVNGGVLDVQGNSFTVGRLSGVAGTITNGSFGATLTVNTTVGVSGTFGGSINDGVGTLTLTKSGAGILYLTGTNGYSGGTNVFGGTLNVNYDAALGNPAASISFNNGTLQLSASGFNSNRSIILTGGGTLDINGFDSTLNGLMSGTRAFGKLGLGTLTLAGTGSTCGQLLLDAGTTVIPAGASLADSSFMSVPQLTGQSAALNVAGSLTDSTDFNVGDQTGTTGTVYVQGGAFVSGKTLYVGKSGNSVGFMFQTGGTVQIGSANDNKIAGNTSNASSATFGYYGISAGSLSVAGNFQPGAYGTGILDQSGGTVSVGAFPSVARQQGSFGIYNLAAGVLNQTNAADALIIGEQGIGVLNVGSSGIANLSGGLLIGNSPTGNGEVNLAAGGFIAASRVYMTLGASTFNFNGGILRAGSSSTSFMQGLTNAYVYGGGVIFDANGNNITVGQSLQGASGYGLNGGSIGVPGGSGGSGYLAPPAVQITGGNGTGATGFAILDGSGHVAGVVITNPGRGYQAGDTLTAAFIGGLASGGTTGAAPLSITSSNLSPDSSGGLTLIGSGALTVSGTNTYAGPTTISSGTLTAATPASLPGWSAPGNVTVAGGAGLIVRTGDGNSGFSAPQIDTILGVSGTGSVSFANSSSTFGFDTTTLSLTYSSNIVGKNLSLAVLGSNTLTLSGSNSYTGTTTFSGTNGTLVLSNAAAVPGAIVWPSNGNNLVLNVNNGVFTNNITNVPGSGRFRLIAARRT